MSLEALRFFTRLGGDGVRDLEIPIILLVDLLTYVPFKFYGLMSPNVFALVLSDVFFLVILYPFFIESASALATNLSFSSLIYYF